MASAPRISVIVPFYNSERFAARCLDSLLSQTYGSYEIVCINDGSTDGTWRVLEGYLSDERVRVFHIENGGQSVARNFGVRQARGSFVTFVDSDDFVSPRFLEILAAASDMCGGGLVVSDFVTVPESTRVDSVSWKMSGPMACVGGREIVDCLLYDELPSAACGKLAPKSLYECVPFPEGHVYEDVMMAMDLVSQSDSFCIVKEPIYAYVMRAGSTVWDGKPSDSKIDDYLVAADMLPDKALEMFPDKKQAADYFRCLFYSRIHTCCLKSDSRRAKDVDRIVLRGVKDLLPSVLRDSRVSYGQRVRFMLAAHFTKLYDAAYSLYVRMKKTGGAA